MILTSEANTKKTTTSECMKEKYHKQPDYWVQHVKKRAANRGIKLSKEALTNLKLQHARRIRRKYRRNAFTVKLHGLWWANRWKWQYKHFTRTFKMGPHMFALCHRALFPSQVKYCNRGDYTKNMHVVADCLTGTYVHMCGSECVAPCSVPKERTQEWIFYTCDNHLIRWGMPPIAAANKLHLAPVPTELAELTILERQLIAKILPFAKIVFLPKGQQRGIHGAVVCVPSDMETAVNSLTRPSAEAQLFTGGA